MSSSRNPGKAFCSRYRNDDDDDGGGGGGDDDDEADDDDNKGAEAVVRAAELTAPRPLLLGEC